MATTRFRNTFHYPADDSDGDDTPKDLDEEEQERLINNLKEKDDERNEIFRRFLLVFPIVSAIAFLPTLASGVVRARLVCFLSITSLTCTAYTLIFIPNSKSKATVLNQGKRLFEPENGPIHQNISLLNGGLSLLILFNAFGFRGRVDVHEGFWLLCTLPAFIFLVVMSARQIMSDVDVSELERLKYGYKGA